MANFDDSHNGSYSESGTSSEGGSVKSGSHQKQGGQGGGVDAQSGRRLTINNNLSSGGQGGGPSGGPSGGPINRTNFNNSAPYRVTPNTSGNSSQYSSSSQGSGSYRPRQNFSQGQSYSHGNRSYGGGYDGGQGGGQGGGYRGGGGHGGGYSNSGNGFQGGGGGRYNGEYQNNRRFNNGGNAGGNVGGNINITRQSGFSKNHFSDISQEITEQHSGKDIESLISSLGETERKEAFERFLTYRRRISRMAIVQAMYCYELNILMGDFLTMEGEFLPISTGYGAKPESMTEGEEALKKLEEKNKNIVITYSDSATHKLTKSRIISDTFRFYKYVFFKPEEYGASKKSRKVDEDYCQDLFYGLIPQLERIDNVLSRYLNENWTVERLDFLVRAILRCGAYELLTSLRTDAPILTSEYTNVASNFFSGKEIGFVNGILDKIAKNDREKEIERQKVAFELEAAKNAKNFPETEKSVKNSSS